MAKNKLKKFAELAAWDNVFEFPVQEILQGKCSPQKGKWAEFFGNDNPIVLELGCGRGEYSVALAERDPNANFIGVDIKGSRMWTGARLSQSMGLRNVAFVRTSIEMLSAFFAEDEVSEIWLTFPDPQMKKQRKRLTSQRFLKLYSGFLKDGGTVRLKTDSNFLFTYTRQLIEANNLPLEVIYQDIYAEEENPLTLLLTTIQTYYEKQWLSRGITIKYLEFRLPKSANIKEISDEGIELDTYRSFGRDQRSKLRIN